MARVKSNTIVGPFIPHRVDMLESAAWAGLSLAARKVLDRLEIEHMRHGGADNGQLPCTYDDFERFGIRRKSVADALAELVGLGFVEVTHQGRGGNAAYRHSSRYRLTYLHTKKAAATDEWKNRTPAAKTPLAPVAKAPPTESTSGGEIAPTASGADTPLLSISREEQGSARAVVVASHPMARVNEDGQAGGFAPISEALAWSLTRMKGAA
jgi:hypothetical protein